MDLIKLNQFPAVAANARSTLVTDQLRGMSLHGLIFERGGGAFTNAHLSNIRLQLNGKSIVDQLTGTQLVDINDYDGLTDVTNYTCLFFGDPTARTIRGQHFGDIDLSLYQYPLSLDVNIGGATTPTLNVYALTSVPKQAMGIGFTQAEAAQFRAMIPTTIQPSAAVTRNSYGVSLGSAPGALLRRIAFFHTNLTSVEMKKQSLTKWDDISIALNAAVEQQYARTPQSGLYMLDRVFDGNQGEAEQTVKQDGTPWNMQVNITTSGSDTINAFADVITNFAQL